VGLLAIPGLYWHFFAVDSPHIQRRLHSTDDPRRTGCDTKRDSSLKTTRTMELARCQDVPRGPNSGAAGC